MRKVLQILSTWSDSDVEWILRHGSKECVPTGTFLIQQGICIDHLYILLDGRVSVRFENSERMPPVPLFAGELIGEISFVDSRPPTASVVAEVDSKVLSISRAVLTAKLQQDPAFSGRFFQALAMFLADRLRSTVEHLGYGPSREHVEVDELDDTMMDGFSTAALRFNTILQRLGIESSNATLRPVA